MTMTDDNLEALCGLMNKGEGKALKHDELKARFKRGEAVVVEVHDKPWFADVVRQYGGVATKIDNDSLPPHVRSPHRELWHVEACKEHRRHVYIDARGIICARPR